ncbi:transcriptional activator NhaR [Viridibacterium curvum]|uniref:Transcriptional activator NhaR n=1 Tax=Viridibacterium curvum TaxID=1101404 RepID=A0ABP9QP82_9RHOO
MNYKHLHYFWSVARAGSIAKASEKLFITPQTLSGQIKLLEDQLGHALFRKSGRKLELTEEGRFVLDYAEDIFSLGAELESALRSGAALQQAIEFRVGVADSVPKSVALRLLEPAMQLAEPVRMVCREWKLDRLLSELALHRLDLVISDAPMPPGSGLKAFNHQLGRSTISFFAAPAIAAQCKGAFPASLDGVPMLCMGDDAAVWGGFRSWLDRHGIQPRIVAEFDDGALMKAFGGAGHGVFMGPSVLAEEICRQYGVTVVGESEELTESFYAVSVERRITHPCVAAITEAARTALFAPKKAAARKRRSR